jgi:hypothetical protein
MDEIPDDVVGIAREMVRQSIGGNGLEPWTGADWDAVRRAFRGSLEKERSAFRLGEVLRHDLHLDLPVEVVKGCYERLFELGATDARTRLCYARYLQQNGPAWDEVLAARILRDVEGPARAAGLWANPALGHHPVFYTGPS